MRKFKFIIPILLLVILVLVGAWCGKEEPKEEKTGKSEEEEESLSCPKLTCYPGFTVGDFWEEPMAGGATSINVICVATGEVDRDEILEFHEQEYTSMGWKKEPYQDHILYLSSGENFIIVSPPIPELTPNYSLECLEYKVGPGEQEEEEEEEEEENSLLYPEIVCPEGFPQDFIYPKATCRDGFCKEADPPYASYECGVMFYSEDKETDVIKWYKARFSDYNDWVFLGEEETDIGTVYRWRNETELTVREQFRLTMLPREGFDKSFTKFSIGYIDNR